MYVRRICQQHMKLFFSTTRSIIDDKEEALSWKLPFHNFIRDIWWGLKVFKWWFDHSILINSAYWLILHIGEFCILSLSIVISYHLVIQIFTSCCSGIVIGEKLMYSYQCLSGHILTKEPSHIDEFLEIRIKWLISSKPFLINWERSYCKWLMRYNC